MLVLDAAAVRAALPMARAVDVAAQTFAALAAGSVEQPPRQFTRPTGLELWAGLMPCTIADDEPVHVVKLVTITAGNLERGLPSVHGLVAVLDGETGVPLAVLDGASLTAVRTAAVSGLATRLLAAPDASDLAVIGAGAQGRAHLEAMAVVRTLERVRVWNRSPGRAQDFAAWAASRGWDCTVVATVPAATAGADLICVCTDAATPLVEAADVSDGTHVNAIGAFTATTRELAADLVARARVVVDDHAAAAEEAGDILLAQAEGAIGADHVEASLVELAGGTTFTRAPGDVTVFKSVGLSAEDAFAARAVLHAASRDRLGVEV